MFLFQKSICFVWNYEIMDSALEGKYHMEPEFGDGLMHEKATKRDKNSTTTTYTIAVLGIGQSPHGNDEDHYENANI